MNWVKTINDAIEYMENHLTDEIALADIAKHVNLSAFHFQRAFSLLTEMSPAEYLRKRRLSQAGADLAGGDEKVIDVAMKYCYDSPESFTKAFTRFHGFSPMQVKKGSPIQFMNRFTVHMTIEGGSIMEYTIEKWEAMDLLMHAKTFHAETSEDEIPKFWDEYYAHEEYRKIPGYLGLCAQQKTDSEDISDSAPSRKPTVMNSGTASAAKLPMWKVSRRGSRSSIFRNTPGRFSNVSGRHPRRFRLCGNGFTRNGCRLPTMS